MKVSNSIFLALIAVMIRTECEAATIKSVFNSHTVHTMDD